MDLGKAELAAEFSGTGGGNYVFLPCHLLRRKKQGKGGPVRGPGGCSGRVPGEEGASVESTPPQVVGDDDICDSVEHELDVVGVGGAGDVSVDLLVGRLVLALVLSLDVRHRLRESVGACRRGRGEEWVKASPSIPRVPANPVLGMLLQPRCPLSISGMDTATSQDCCQAGDAPWLSAQLYFYSELLFIVSRDEMDGGAEC